MKEAEERKKLSTTDTLALRKLQAIESSSVNISRKHSVSLLKQGVEKSVALDASML